MYTIYCKINNGGTMTSKSILHFMLEQKVIEIVLRLNVK